MVNFSRSITSSMGVLVSISFNLGPAIMTGGTGAVEKQFGDCGPNPGFKCAATDSTVQAVTATLDDVRAGLETTHSQPQSVHCNVSYIDTYTGYTWKVKGINVQGLEFMNSGDIIICGWANNQHYSCSCDPGTHGL